MRRWCDGVWRGKRAGDGRFRSVSDDVTLDVGAAIALNPIFLLMLNSIKRSYFVPIAMEVADIKREIELLAERLGKTQEYL